jgi:hypothetical protein
VNILERRLPVWVIIVVGVVVVALGLSVLDQFNGWFSDRLHQVKRSVDPAGLQQWAAKLLAAHGSGYEDFYGSNVPSGYGSLPWRAHLQARPSLDFC